MTVSIAEKARIIDVSVYQQEINWSYLGELHERNLLHGIIIRQGQGDWEDDLFAAHVQGAYDAGLPALAYHVHEPRLYTSTGVLDEDRWPKIADDWQMTRIRKSLTHKRLYGLAIDVEVVKEFDSKTITDAWLSRTARHHKAMVDKEFGTLYEFRPIYSADWYLGYTPSTKVWLHEHDLWWAKYIQPKQVTALLRWEDLERYLPGERYWPWPECTGILEGRKRAILWQWTGDTFVVPGIYAQNHKPTAIDFNLYDGTPKEWCELIGFVPADSGDNSGDNDDVGDGNGGGIIPPVAGTEWQANMLTAMQRTNALLEEQNALLRSLNEKTLKDLIA